MLQSKSNCCKLVLTHSWRRSLSYRNQPIDLQSKSMDWLLYYGDLRHERVKRSHLIADFLELRSNYRTAERISQKCPAENYEPSSTDCKFIKVVAVKGGLSPSKKICFICFIESPLKIMKNAFYFILRALFVLKIFKFFS